MSSWEEKYINKRSAVKRIHRLKRRLVEISDNIKLSDKQETGKLLEIGTGDGMLLDALEKLFPSFDFTGIESKDELIGLIKNKKQRVIKAEASNMPFKDSEFDFVVMSATIEHIIDPDSALKEIKRVIKNEGVLIITWPNPFWDRINQVFVDTGHCKKFTFKKMKKLLQNNGFKITRSYGFMLFPFFKIPFQRLLENALKLIKLDFLLFNYLVVAKEGLH